MTDENAGVFSESANNSYSFQASFGGCLDGFVSKISSDGSVAATTYLGGTGNDSAKAIALTYNDMNPRLIVVGETDSADWLNSTSTVLGGVDTFVVALNLSLSGTGYSSVFGGGGTDIPTGVVTDGASHAYVVGLTTSCDLPALNSYGGATDGYLARLDITGSGPSSMYSGGADQIVYYGDSGDQVVNGVALDSWSGGIDVVGTDSTSNDAFVARYQPDLSLNFSRSVGGDGAESGTGLALDGQGYIAVTGTSSSNRLSGGTGTANPSGYFAWLNPDGSQILDQMRFGDYSTGTAISMGGNGAVYASGAAGSDAYSVKIWPGLQPPVPVSISDDTGCSSTDFLTKTPWQTVSGTGMPYGVVDVRLIDAFSNTTSLGQIAIDGSGSWTAALSNLYEGVYRVEARPVVNGQVFDAPQSLEFRIDTTAPSINSFYIAGSNSVTDTFHVAVSEGNPQGGTVTLTVDGTAYTSTPLNSSDIELPITFSPGAFSPGLHARHRHDDQRL